MNLFKFRKFNFIKNLIFNEITFKFASLWETLKDQYTAVATVNYYLIESNF